MSCVMGLESNPLPSSSSASSTPSPSGKRSRDPEDEVYLDNFHSHKRYLSEIMASSLNGLTVGDPTSENIMDSPARSETMFYLRDEMSCQYSPMSEDSDDSRFCDGPISTPDSIPSSPVSSPYRYQRPLSGTNSQPSHCTSSSISNSPYRQRGSDSEGRFPSSPSDICHSADLRRAALLRSVQMRALPSNQSVLELPYNSVQESGPNIEADEQPCSCMKSMVDQGEYHIEECPSLAISEPEFEREKPCRVLDMNNVKESEPGGERSRDFTGEPL